jgi:competence protein ComEC
MDEIWKVTTVSLAAQLATFSLGLLYFNQFPNYFLLSNLLVIPLSFCVLLMGLAVLFLSFIQPVAAVVGALLELIIKVMNVATFTVEKLPFSLSDKIYITTFQCILLMAATLALVLLVQRRQFKFVWMACGLLIAFSCMQWMHFHRDIDRQQITIYKINHHAAMDFIDRGKAYFFADSSLLADNQKIKYHISPNRLIHGVSVVETDGGAMFRKELPGCSLMVWNRKRILYINDKSFTPPPGLRVDYCVLGNNATQDLLKKNFAFHFNTLILDSSNSFYVADKIMKQAKKLNIEAHSVLHDGAFVVEI